MSTTGPSDVPEARDIEARDDAAIILPLSLAQSARKFDARDRGIIVIYSPNHTVEDIAAMIREYRAAVAQGTNP